MAQQVLPDAPPRRERVSRRRRSPFAVIIGIIGELLITAGLFVGLFVVWQIWWTDIEQRRYQGEVLAEFDAEAEPVEVDDLIEDDEKRYDDAPLLPRVPSGGVLGSLRVPEWDEYYGGEYRVTISEFIDPMMENLDQGYAVRYDDGGHPGHLGNFSLAGHRQSYGAAFYHVDDLELGDAIIVETRENWFVYRVSEKKIVLPTDVDVIAANPYDPGQQPTERLLTLTTCHPLFSTRERYIVHAEFDYWAPRSAGMPQEMMED